MLNAYWLYVKCKSSTLCLLCCLYFQLFKEKAADGSWRKKETSFRFCDDLEKTNCTCAFVYTVLKQRCSVGRRCSCKEMWQNATYWRYSSIKEGGNQWLEAFSDSNAAFQTVITGPGNGEPSEMSHTGMNHKHYRNALPAKWLFVAYIDFSLCIWICEEVLLDYA